MQPSASVSISVKRISGNVLCKKIECSLRGLLLDRWLFECCLFSIVDLWWMCKELNAGVWRFKLMSDEVVWWSGISVTFPKLMTLDSTLILQLLTLDFSWTLHFATQSLDLGTQVLSLTLSLQTLYSTQTVERQTLDSNWDSGLASESRTMDSGLDCDSMASDSGLYLDVTAWDSGLDSDSSFGHQTQLGVYSLRLWTLLWLNVGLWTWIRL